MLSRVARVMDGKSVYIVAAASGNLARGGVGAIVVPGEVLADEHKRCPDDQES